MKSIMSFIKENDDYVLVVMICLTTFFMISVDKDLLIILVFLSIILFPIIFLWSLVKFINK
ncbi:hypothetical protein [Vagococcus hydrophili]|uniref:Uncharacterized protein n=1 Tax=Vagococcus hydrophili TaxID=2714947 RepID=A0A6G8AU35_9ENTE|nr:hypothetical protein [Vagococcus hydrophili]QIL48574.1 hypothetical protein G7082_08705 [Vagococcus hydrophili]